MYVLFPPRGEVDGGGGGGGVMRLAPVLNTIYRQITMKKGASLRE